MTVIIDLTPVRDGTGPARLLDMVEGRSKQAFKTWLADCQVEVEATWGIYQRMIAAHRHEDRRQGHELMVTLIDSISTGVPKALAEVMTLGRTLKKRAADVLAHFDRSSTRVAPPSGSAASPTASPDRC